MLIAKKKGYGLNFQTMPFLFWRGTYRSLMGVSVGETYLKVKGLQELQLIVIIIIDELNSLLGLHSGDVDVHVSSEMKNSCDIEFPYITGTMKQIQVSFNEEPPIFSQNLICYDEVLLRVVHTLRSQLQSCDPNCIFVY